MHPAKKEDNCFIPPNKVKVTHVREEQMWKMETSFPTEADGFMFIYSPKNTAFWKKNYPGNFTNETQ